MIHMTEFNYASFKTNKRKGYRLYNLYLMKHTEYNYRQAEESKLGSLLNNL